MRLRQWKDQPIVSALFVAVNVCVYLLCDFSGELLYDKGGLTAEAVLNGKEYGRIITSIFLHEDISHIFNNMLILFFLGAMLERELGHIRLGVLYLLSGVGGNLLSLLSKVMNQETAMSIGASGAIFGLDGVLLAMVLLWPKRMENVTSARVLLMIVLSLYSGFTGEHIDNAAHVGGLLTGFLLGVVVCICQRRCRRKNQTNERYHFEY